LIYFTSADWLIFSYYLQVFLPVFYHDSETARIGNKLRACFEAGFVHQVLNVGFYRSDRNVEPLGNLGVGVPIIEIEQLLHAHSML